MVAKIWVTLVLLGILNSIVSTAKPISSGQLRLVEKSTTPEEEMLKNHSKLETPPQMDAGRIESTYFCGDKEYKKSDPALEDCWNQTDPASPTLSKKSRGIGVRLK